MMHIARYRLFLLTMCVALVACHTSRRVALEEVVIRARDEEYRAAAARVWDITHNKVALSFNWKEKTANGRAWLELHPYFYSTDSLWLDAKAMRIDSVALLTGNNTAPLKYVHEDDKLKIRFDRQWTRYDNIGLYIKYLAMPYDAPAGGGKAISEDRGLYFINTDNALPNKPMQIWTQGETESNSHWMPCIDKPNERFTMELELTVPDSFVTLSNGQQVSQTKNTDGGRTDKWKIDKAIQAYAVMFAIGNYAIVKDEWRGKEVSYYVEPEYAPYARKMFAHTTEMMEFYSGITGLQYPWNKYSQVVVRDYVSGAMENTTATTFGEFINQNFRQIADKDYEYIVAHELFHQWFGDYVTAESWSNLTVNESFANYGEYLWKLHKHGYRAAEDAALSELWNYVYGQAPANDPPLVRFHYKDMDHMFDRVSYQKGGAILKYLHGLIGDSAFYKSMNLYLATNALQSAEATHWRLAVEKVTGQDWNWFFNQWYYRGGHPVLDLKYSYNDEGKQLTVTAQQKQAGKAYHLPLKTWLIYGDEIDTVDWNIEKKTEYFTYDYKNGKKPVVVADINHWLVGEISQNLSPEQWLQVFKLSRDNIPNKRFAVGAARKTIENDSSIALFDEALNDDWYSIRVLTLKNIEQLKGDKWKERWKDKVMQMARTDKNNLVRAAAFNLLKTWQVKGAKQDMLNALSDSSYAVAGAALDAFYAVAGADRDTVYTIAKQMLSTHPQGDLRTAIWDIIAEQGKASDANLFAAGAWEFYSSYKISFAAAISTYLQHVISNKAFDTALATLVELQEMENISSYRGSVAAYIFDAAATYKKLVANARTKSEEAEMREKYEKLREAIDSIIAAETNESNRKQYKNYRKIIYGES